MPGVADLSATRIHHRTTIFVLAVNISTCTVFMQGRSVEQRILFVQHGSIILA